MMNSFALQNIINLTQGSGIALHPGGIPDGPGFPILLAREQLAAEQASIPSETFLPDSKSEIVKALGNGQRVDLNKVTIASVGKGAELAYNKKASYLIPDGRIQHPVFRKLDLHRHDPHPGPRIQDPGFKDQHSELSRVSSPKSQVSYLMPYVYPLTDQLVKVDIKLSKATEDFHRLDPSHVNAGADIRALRHTSYVMRHRHDVTQPSVIHIASQPETIERVVQTPLPDQPFLQVKQTTDHRSRITDHELRITNHGNSPKLQFRQPSHDVQRPLPDQPFLQVKPTGQSQLIMDHQPLLTDHGLPITDHELRITDYGLRITDYESPITDHGLRITDHGNSPKLEFRQPSHDVVYTNSREVLPRSFVVRPGVIPDDIIESPHVVILSKAPAEKQIFYANPKSDTPDLWVKVAGNVEEKNPGGVITSVKHGSGYTEEGSEVSVQVKGTSEVYRQPETEHAPRVDTSQVKPSVQVQRVIYVPSGNGELEQREIGKMGERPVISNATYSRSGSPADEVINTPVREDNRGNSETQLRIEVGDYRPTHQIEAPIDTSSRGMGDFPHVFREQGSPKLSLQDNGIRFDTVTSSTFEGASVAEKVQASQQQEIISQAPIEYVRIEGNIQEIQPELAGEKNVDRIHQPLRQEINPQDIQGYVKHPQLSDEVRSEMQYAAASLDAFEGTSVAEKVQESQLQQIIPEIPQKPVRIEGKVQEIQPESVGEEKVDRIHQPLRQEIRPQNLQEYGKHSEPNDDAKIEMRYGIAPSHVFEGASVAGKVQVSQQQEIMPQTPREYVRIEGKVQEIQPELAGEKNVDRIHQPLPQEISLQDVQEYGEHPESNNDAKIEMRYGIAPSHVFEEASIAEKVQVSHSQEIISQTSREYVRIEGDVQEIRPEPIAEEKVDRIYQPLRQEISSQEVQEYGKHPEPNDNAKIEARYGTAPLDAFEGASIAEKVQKLQPQEVILQAVQESVRAKDEVQEIQPELSSNKETGRTQQLVQQEVGPQNVQEYGKNPEFRVENQPFGKEVQATASMPELQDKVPFYVSKVVAGERLEAIWIQLEPENLGKVKLRVLLRDDRISVNLSVNRPETKGIIELQVPGIRRSLAQHEINVTEFRVSLENGFSNSNPRYSNLFHDNANTNSRPAYERGDWNRDQSEHSNRQRHYRSDSLVDLFA